MPEFQVPQFIDIEDKVIGPFTVKQFLWLLLGAGLMFILWTSFPFGLFLVVGSPVAALFLGLAFYKVNGRTFLSFLVSALVFLVSPKKLVWEKDLKPRPQVFSEAEIKDAPHAEKISGNRLKDIAWKLDI